MFRGLTRSEHLVVLAFVATLTVSSTVSWLRNRPGKHAVAIESPLVRGGSSGESRHGGEGILPPPAVESSTEGVLEDGRIDLNVASAGTLETLPGIGPERAAAIVRRRNAAGPFPTVDALAQVSGIGPETVEALRPMIFVTPPPGAPDTAEPAAESDPASTIVDLNTATVGELATLDGIGPKLAASIVRHRDLRGGRFQRIEDILKIDGIGPATLEKNRHRLVLR